MSASEEDMGITVQPANNPLADHLATLKTDIERSLSELVALKSRMRARRDLKGARIVDEMIRTRKELMERLDLSNYGGDT